MVLLFGGIYGYKVVILKKNTNVDVGFGLGLKSFLSRSQRCVLIKPRKSGGYLLHTHIKTQSSWR